MVLAGESVWEPGSRDLVVRSPAAEQTLVHTQERQPTCRRGTHKRGTGGRDSN